MWYAFFMTFTFLVIGVLAGVFLLISFLLDGLLDIFHIDFMDGAIGPTTGSVFLSVFGFTGAFVSSTTDWGIVPVVAVALAVGFAVFAIVAAITRTLRKSESGYVSDNDLVGKHATVTLDIPQGGTGKISVMLAGHQMSRNATSSDEITEGTKVVIDSIVSLNHVAVSPVNSITGNTAVKES